MIDVALADESARLAALRRLRVLDTGSEPQFEKIVALVRTLLAVPMAAVSLVDADRQWFKARSGLAEAELPRAGSFCTHTVDQCEPLVVADAEVDPRFKHSPLVLGAPHIRSYVGIPLTMPDGYRVGALCAIDTIPRRFDLGQVAVLAQLAALVVDELELRQIAMRDEGTGALSRRGFMAATHGSIERCHSPGRAGAVAVFDVDHFKRVNDMFGHPAGDAVLREIVSRCHESLRQGDTIGRIGGEEFGILLPQTGWSEAGAIVERIRATIANRGFALPEGGAIPITASFGIAAFESASTAEAVIAGADVALYAAKRGGRNRCVLADSATRAAA